MNFLLRSNSQSWRRCNRVLNLQLLSPKALIFSFSSSSAPLESLSLQKRISAVLSEDPSASVVPILQQWIDQGKEVTQSHLRNIISMLRGNTRYNHALQLSDWMVEKSGYSLSAEEAAVRLDLISRIRGLEEAEKYLNSFNSFDRTVYIALLRCYANAKQMEKAEALIQRMKDKMFIIGPPVYTEMLNLYSKLFKFDKLEALAREMEEKGIYVSKAAYTCWLNAYVACSNIDGVEKLLVKIENDQYSKPDFDFYSIASNAYRKTCQIDKALMMLKRAEQLISSRSRRPNYEILLAQYAALGKKADVYRIWNLYKDMEKQFNSGYLAMMTSLVKLDDMDGADVIWKEWKSWHTNFDIRVPNVMIGAYSIRGSWKKAEQYVNEILEMGKDPNLVSWNYLASAYLQGNQTEKAVDAVKKAILSSTQERVPGLDCLTRCFEYLKAQGDTEGADGLLKLIEEKSQFPTGTSWIHLATGYLLKGETAKATEMVTKAVMASTTELQPKFGTLSLFLRYLKREGDRGAVQELLKKILQHCHFSKDVFSKLERCVNDEENTGGELCREDDDLILGRSDKVLKVKEDLQMKDQLGNCIFGKVKYELFLS